MLQKSAGDALVSTTTQPGRNSKPSEHRRVGDASSARRCERKSVVRYADPVKRNANSQGPRLSRFPVDGRRFGSRKLGLRHGTRVETILVVPMLIWSNARSGAVLRRSVRGSVELEQRGRICLVARFPPGRSAITSSEIHRSEWPSVNLRPFIRLRWRNSRPRRGCSL